LDHSWLGQYFEEDLSMTLTGFRKTVMSACPEKKEPRNDRRKSILARLTTD
jgi:hypothetical protein